MLHHFFPHGRFSAPATDDQIAAVETELGLVLPRQLRDLYLECDGFREDRGNARLHTSEVPKVAALTLGIFLRLRSGLAR